ncbi:hypothetical protein [Parasphingorhabdus sp.]|uniref:hypothetical protein n=1 Tax=Parasphingorhabdus sp. TaxID=2709688 RepID=UPI003A951C87
MAILLIRNFLIFSGLACASALASCAQSVSEPVDEANCRGLFLKGPEVGDEDSQSFTINELMAHSAALGMTQEEAETLLYLKGISPHHKLAPGETLCIEQ